MKNALFLIVLVSFFSSCKENITNPGRIQSDTISIGSQVWMTKNLNVDHYRNGDPIPEVKDLKLWAKLTTGAWCYYNNDTSMGAIYGKLYNWYAVNDPRGLAPEGWHIPSNSELSELETYLGGGIAGGKMKESGTYHWGAPNCGATNESGFSALPGGHLYIYYEGEGSYKCELFLNVGGLGNWWSSTEYGNTSAHFWYLSSNDVYIQWAYCSKVNGLSVRCIKDN